MRSDEKVWGFSVTIFIHTPKMWAPADIHASS